MRADVFQKVNDQFFNLKIQQLFPEVTDKLIEKHHSYY